MRVAMALLLVCLASGCVLVPSGESPGAKAGGGTVLLCHKGKKTMELPREAAQGHIKHGDAYGPC